MKLVSRRRTLFKLGYQEIVDSIQLLNRLPPLE